MCGIFFALYKCSPNDLNIDEINFEMLKKRGPDFFHAFKFGFNEFTIVLAASVLSLRGGNSSQLTKQPLLDSLFNSGNVLLWNGELFSSDLVQVDLNENDGVKILNKLSESYDSITESDILKVVESIKGPYAFIFYEKKTNSIYFGRDRMGRRSLLIGSNLNLLNESTTTAANSIIKSDLISTPILMLSSVQINLNNFSNDLDELKATAIYKFNLYKPNHLTIYEWKRSNQLNESHVSLLDESYPFKIEIKRSELFLNNSISPFNETIDNSYEQETFDKLVEMFYEVLNKSVLRRTQNLPNYCKACSHSSSDHQTIKFNDKNLSQIACEHAKLAILFSGGVDSAVLAAMADLCLPPNDPIDLLNIAFEKPKRVLDNKRKKPFKSNDKTSEEDLHLTKDEFLVPDRISGLECLKELNPNRKWNFVEINVTIEELKTERENLIKHLLYPHQTVLDDSIGCALWFASRGIGQINSGEKKKINYKSNAEVLLLGMGADEQLAGYVRHRTKYEKAGLKALADELKMEMERISERNLGRDDRILSDHGKESRLPYLDEDLISFLNELDIKYKCNMELPRGDGEKYLLRTMASKKFGLNYSSKLQKRAIQFGSRVAKIENTKEKASDICERISKNLNLSSNQFDE